jgi:hypothetical protein
MSSLSSLAGGLQAAASGYNSRCATRERNPSNLPESSSLKGIPTILRVRSGFAHIAGLARSVAFAPRGARKVTLSLTTLLILSSGLLGCGQATGPDTSGDPGCNAGDYVCAVVNPANTFWLGRAPGRFYQIAVALNTDGTGVVKRFSDVPTNAVQVTWQRLGATAVLFSANNAGITGLTSINGSVSEGTFRAVVGPDTPTYTFTLSAGASF